MASPTPQPVPVLARDAAYWAQLATARLTVGRMPPEAVNLNVEGHRVFGPLQGFGQLWRKTFRIRLAGCPELTPTEVVRVWKAEFPRFWPAGQRYFASPRGIVPGEVALLNLRAGDPVFELIMRSGGFRFEDGVWQHTLKALAARFEVDCDVQTEEICLDRRVQWAYVPNIWYNAGMRTAFYFAAAPLRWVIQRARRSKHQVPPAV